MGSFVLRGMLVWPVLIASIEVEEVEFIQQVIIHLIHQKKIADCIFYKIYLSAKKIK